MRCFESTLYMYIYIYLVSERIKWIPNAWMEEGGRDAFHAMQYSCMYVAGFFAFISISSSSGL
jgi:hypothetical protein